VICQWDPLDGTLVRTLLGHAGTVFAMSVGGVDGAVLFSGSLDCTIRLWSTADGLPLQTLTGHTAPVVALAVGADGVLFSGSTDSTIRAWAETKDDGGRNWACTHKMHVSWPR
jgi:WD40 repeat protein